MLSEAYRIGKIEENPWKRVPPLSEATTLQGILTIEEARTLLHPQNVEKLWEGNHLAYTVNLIAALTALRQGEILSIKTGDVFPDHLHIEHSWHRKYGQNQTKTKIIADLPIPPILYAQIKPYTEYNSPYVFSLDGWKRPYTAGKTATWLYRAMRNIGISDKEKLQRNIKFQSWRAFFNTNLRAAGVPDATIWSVTRHATEEMTNYYTRFNPEHFTKVVEVQQMLLN